MRRNPMATETRATAGLIASDKVEGTAVYDTKGKHIGSTLLLDSGGLTLPRDREEQLIFKTIEK